MDHALNADEPVPARPTSLALAVAVSLLSLAATFLAWYHKDFGIPNLSRLVDHPAVAWQLLITAAGGSFGLPLIHLAVASLFKSRRNPSARRNIFIGWGSFVVLLHGLTLAMGS